MDELVQAQVRSVRSLKGSRLRVASQGAPSCVRGLRIGTWIGGRVLRDFRDRPISANLEVLGADDAALPVGLHHDCLGSVVPRPDASDAAILEKDARCVR